MATAPQGLDGGSHPLCRVPSVGPTRSHTAEGSRAPHGPRPVPASRKPGQHQRPSPRTKTSAHSPWEPQFPVWGGERGLKQHKVAVFSLEDCPPCPSTCDANQRLEGPPSIWAEGVVPPLNHHPIQELEQQAGTLGSWLHSAAGGHSWGTGGDRLSKKGLWGSGRTRCEQGQSLPGGWSPCGPAAPTAQPGR